MSQSESIAQLAAALAKAQGEMRHASTDAVNPAYKSRYATLASVLDACREPLSRNKLSCTHTTDRDAAGRVILETKLMHESGEWIAGYYPVVPLQETPQGYGSAMTYARRYTLSAMVGIAADDDDDGNAAMPEDFDKRRQKARAKPPARPEYPTITSDKDIAAIAEIHGLIDSAETPEMFASVTAKIKGYPKPVRLTVTPAWIEKRDKYFWQTKGL